MRNNGYAEQIFYLLPPFSEKQYLVILTGLMGLSYTRADPEYLSYRIKQTKKALWLLVLTWFNLNSSMDK